MILCVSVGNTNTAISVFDSDDRMLFLTRVATDKQRLKDQYAVTIREMLALYRVPEEKITGMIVASVVPPVTGYVTEGIRHLFGRAPLLVGPGIRTGLNIITDDPAQLGSDIVADAIATIAKYPLPAVVIDMGTATVVSAISASGMYLGCAIYPGVRIAIDALSEKTAQLPFISIEPPQKVIGTDTIDSMRAGVVFGNAGMLDGIVERMRSEVGDIKTIVATGGNSKYIVPYCTNGIVYDENLLMEGLLLIYRRNSKK